MELPELWYSGIILELEPVSNGDFRLGGGDLRQVDTDKLLECVGDLSLGSLSFFAVTYEDVAWIWLAAISCVANLGNGREIGSLLVEVRKCEDSLTGPELSVFSGRSSQRGVPGREPSETSSAPTTEVDPLGLKWEEMRSRSSWWVLLRAESVDDLRTLSEATKATLGFRPLPA